MDYCLSMKDQTTLQTVLSISARVYKILGLILPVVIITRILMQRILRKPLPKIRSFHLRPRRSSEHGRRTFQKSQPYLCYVEISMVKVLGQNKPSYFELFCDASEKAYIIVAYIRSEDCDGVVTVVIVASKARVAPIWRPTLPRLDLLGGHLAV